MEKSGSLFKRVIRVHSFLFSIWLRTFRSDRTLIKISFKYDEHRMPMSVTWKEMSTLSNEVEYSNCKGTFSANFLSLSFAH